MGYGYEFGVAQREDRGLPANFADRDPRIEVYLRCSRCQGDSYDFERKPGGDAVGKVGIGSTTNCRACNHGVQWAVVPLRDAIAALAKDDPA